jgi:hypothetical protein
MSETYAAAGLQIRRLLGDLDPGAYIFDTPFDLYGALTPTMQQMAGRAGHGQTWALNAFSSSAGSLADAALPSSVQYAQVLDIRDTVFGRILAKLGMDEIEAWRQGLTTSSPSSGVPVAYSLREDIDQVVYVRFNCVPNSVIPYDVLRSTIPTTGYLDATTLPFSDEFCRGVEMATALRLANRATPEQKARLSLSPDALRDWAMGEQSAIQLEKVRLRRIKSRPYGVGAILGR